MHCFLVKKTQLCEDFLKNRVEGSLLLIRDWYVLVSSSLIYTAKERQILSLFPSLNRKLSISGYCIASNTPHLHTQGPMSSSQAAIDLHWKIALEALTQHATEPNLDLVRSSIIQMYECMHRECITPSVNVLRLACCHCGMIYLPTVNCTVQILSSRQLSRRSARNRPDSPSSVRRVIKAEDILVRKGRESRFGGKRCRTWLTYHCHDCNWMLAIRGEAAKRPLENPQPVSCSTLPSIHPSTKRTQQLRNLMASTSSMRQQCTSTASLSLQDFLV